MQELDEPETCKRCGRDAPRKLDGVADDPDWALWEVTEEEVICPGCRTTVELRSSANDPEWESDHFGH